MSFVSIAYASQHIATAQGFLAKINAAILFPLITLLMAVALLLFLWGGFEYVKNSGSDQGREQGRRHLIWGVIGMLVMLSAYSILTIAAGTFGLEGELQRLNTPQNQSGTNVNRAPVSGSGATAGTGGVTAGNTGGVTSGNEGGTTAGNAGGVTSGSTSSNPPSSTALRQDMISNGFNDAQAGGTIAGLSVLLWDRDINAVTTQVNKLHSDGLISASTRDQYVQDATAYINYLNSN